MRVCVLVSIVTPDLVCASVFSSASAGLSAAVLEQPASNAMATASVSTIKCGARMWSQTQPQRVAMLKRVGIVGQAATGAAHTVALQRKARASKSTLFFMAFFRSGFQRKFFQ